MREILFRGKRVDNGEWIYGDLTQVRYNIHDQNDDRYGLENQCMIGSCEVDEYAMTGYDTASVIPETVGQYTGLVDKNGRKIYEGDIVRVEDEDGDTEFSDGGVGVVSFDDGLWYISGEVNNGLNNLNRCYYISVIGNIHDNPELLEVEE